MKYEISYPGIQRSINEINSSRQKMENLRRRLENVRNGITSPHFWAIRNNVTSRCASVGNAAMATQNFGNAVGSARDEYLSAETKVNGVLASTKSLLDFIKISHHPAINFITSQKEANLLDMLVALVGIGATLSKYSVNNLIYSLLNSITRNVPNWSPYVFGDEINAKNILKKFGSLTDIISEISKKISDGSEKKIDLASSISKYLSSLIGFFGEEKSGMTGYSNLLKLMSSSTGVYSSLYSTIEKYSSAMNAVSLSETWGRYIPAIGMIGSGIGFSQKFLEAWKEEKGYDKTAKWVEAIGGGVKFGGGIFKFMSYSPKILQVTSDNALNISYKAVSAGSKAQNISVYLRIASAGFSTISTGIKSYGKYSNNGSQSLDMGDIGAIGIDASISGLNELFLFGLLDAEKASAGVKDWAGGWGNAAGNYILDNEKLYNYYKNTNGAGQAAATIYAIGATGAQGATEAIGNAVSAAGSAIESGWKYVADGYKEVFKLLKW